jgi:ferredoxin-type protein NapF
MQRPASASPPPSRRALFGLQGKRLPIRPPWSDPAGFTAVCTRCDACIDACPESILQRGTGGFPEISFASAACTFCGDCRTACPEPVFTAGDAPPWSLTAAIDDHCLARQNVVCRSCKEACDSGAIRFQLAVGSAGLPVVDPEACTGCGACVAPCPANAIAITAVGAAA